MTLNNEYIRTSLQEDGEELITSHYINEVLPTTRQYKAFDCQNLIDWADGNGCKSLHEIHNSSRSCNERQVEDALIKPVLESLGNSMIAQVHLGSDTMDFCAYDGDTFHSDFTNTTVIVESKRYGRIQNRYYIRREDNTDEIYQCLNYLRTINLTLDNTSSKHDVNFVVLTDGYLWRIYSKKYTHNNHEFENHFIEFDLERIAMCPNKDIRDRYLRIFGLFMCRESFTGELLRHQTGSGELGTAVTRELREQTFLALEYIATGIWRKIYLDDNPIFTIAVNANYGIDIDAARTDDSERARLLRLVYDESIVFLLRLLFVLYAEDRELFNHEEIPKVIKGKGNLLELIIENGKGIGELSDPQIFSRNDDVALGKVFSLIDEKYNGGLFSRKKHSLLYGLDIDDILFARAIDNLCRVEIKGKLYTVDFSTISVRELGGIYESLLEYKLAIMDRDMDAMPSIINSKRIRHDVKKGDLYLINHKGERKATGSYYTPDLIVDHLVHTALDPMLINIRNSHTDDFKALFDAVLDIKICDPAMGSGHMIQAAFSRLVDFVHQSLEEMRENGTTEAIWDKELAWLVRAQIARKCIYGVDLNPTAVELAKLVMWMKVFRPDKPFEFFDYNLACGNSLIGSYDYTFEAAKAGEALQTSLIESQEEMESNLQSTLLTWVLTMMEMPRDTVEQVHQVDRFWRKNVIPAQKQLTFLQNAKLIQWLMPENIRAFNNGYDNLVRGINADVRYVEKVLNMDEAVPDGVKDLVPLVTWIEEQFRPIHWNIVFPHIAVQGGFDVILSNPPWDKVKPTRGEFFADYIPGYNYMETAAAKRASNELMESHQDIRDGWEAYEQSIKRQDKFYQEAYQYQVVKDASGKKLKGDSNLYKVFLEKIVTILRDGGTCGIVIPDNLNIDNGCTGLRRMLLTQTTIRELIMFENRKKLFDIDSRYKFDVLTFVKNKPRGNAAFDAGFYWYDPIWLDGQPDQDYIRENEKNQKQYHQKYRYSTRFIKETDPDKLLIYEFRNQTLQKVFRKLQEYPALADENQSLYARTYREFDMTNDADLFEFDGFGWPLYQGGMIHHFNAHFKSCEKWIRQQTGESRLSEKWRVHLQELPDRTYRIVWRDIAQPTDTRSLICCVVPRGIFFGNTLGAIELVQDDNDASRAELVAGVNAILSSFTADFFVRQRIAKHVNAFILKDLPLPRDLQTIRELGRLSLPLYDGDDFDAFRGEITALTDPALRDKLIAKLDARTAHLYRLTYEEYQAVLATFPLVEGAQKQRCLQAYNEWMFSLEAEGK